MLHCVKAFYLEGQWQTRVSVVAQALCHLAREGVKSTGFRGILQKRGYSYIFLGCLRVLVTSLLQMRRDSAHACNLHVSVLPKIVAKKATTLNLKFLRFFELPVCEQGPQYNGENGVPGFVCNSAIPHIHPFKILKC